jgi:16S rRNA G966 N2-methylase RsmD
MKRRKRSLSQTGGPSSLSGDPELAKTLAACLEVDPEAKLPFTHGFHAYPARMHPETARRALEAFPGGAVLDPFVGSGTTAVEALRAGRAFTGIDLSPVALEVAWARTRVLHPDECRRFERAALALADRAFSENERPEFRYPPEASPEREWYDPHTLREICVLKGLIDGAEELHRRLLRSVLSSIVVKLSFQASDSDPRKDVYHRTRPRGATFRNFADRCSELTKGLLQLSSDLYKRKVEKREPRFLRGDARVLDGGAADLVLTSPPYPGTYDYALQHQRRYWIFGETQEPVEKGELGARRDFNPGRYRKDLEACLRRMLASAPRAVLLIGDGDALPADALLAELAPKAGGRVVASASQKRRDWSGGPPRKEHLLLIATSASA